MPRLTFPFGPDGLVVSALLGLTAADLAAAQSAGAPSPALLQVRGMIDSRTMVTAVAPRLLARLNVPPGPAPRRQQLSRSDFTR
jgi:hypothetical protein